ncbi:hypothetical protein AYI68_g3319, partial [Smittium mucronatum]
MTARNLSHPAYLKQCQDII